MYRPEGTQLTWHDCTRKQARDVLMRHGISGTLITQAARKFNDPNWSHGPHIYVIDTLTDKGARIDNQGADTYDVKVSSRTGEAMLASLIDTATRLRSESVLDKIVIID